MLASAARALCVLLLFCFFFFFFNDTATTEIYTLSLHDALPILCDRDGAQRCLRRSARTWPGMRSEEHTSELQSRGLISYAVFCLKKKQNNSGDRQTLSCVLDLLSTGSHRVH